MKENCIFCGNKATIARSTGNREYYQCSACGGFFLARQFHLDFQNEKKRYELHNNSLLDSSYKLYLENFINSVCNFPAVRNEIPVKMKRILDYGSGPEPSLATLFELKGYDVNIYDPFFAPVLKKWTEGADLVTCLEVAEHFKNPLKDFISVAECIRGNGFLALGTHLVPEFTIEDAWSFFESWWYRQDLAHVAFYSEKALALVAKNAGLEWLGKAGPNIYIFSRKREALP